MKTIKTTIQLACLSFILILAGCASVKVIDSLSSESSKGYLKVYYLKSEVNPNFHPAAVFYQFVDSIDLFEARVSSRKWNTSSDEVCFVLAKLPGLYYLSTSNKTCFFQIEEGMITPVKIVFTGVSGCNIMQSWGSVSKTELRIDAFSEDPISVAEYNKKERRKKL